MKTKISDAEMKLIIILIALVLIACAYFFGYNGCMKRAKAIEAENAITRSKVTELQSMVARRAEIEKETEYYRQAVKDVIEKYPVYVPQEKAIYLLQDLEDNIDIHLSNIGFTLDNFVSGRENVNGYFANLTMSYETDYQGFKEALEYIRDYDDRMTMPTTTAGYDVANGTMVGSFNVRMYYLTGTGKEYEELPDLGIPSGVDNIFGDSDGGAYAGD